LSVGSEKSLEELQKEYDELPEQFPSSTTAEISASLKVDLGPLWRWTVACSAGYGLGASLIEPPQQDDYKESPLHPVLLDNCFITMLLPLERYKKIIEPHLPFAIDRLSWFRAPEGAVRCLVKAHSDQDITQGVISSDLIIWDDQGVVAE